MGRRRPAYRGLLRLLQPDEATPREKTGVRLAVSIVTGAYVPIERSLLDRGFTDVVPFYDLAESFLMSAFHGGQLRTMKAHYLNDAGDVRVIRPLVYVRERQTRDFAAGADLPVVHDRCPACFSMPTQRQHMKTLLAAEEAHNKLLFRSLLSTLRPLMSEGLPDAREDAGLDKQHA